LFESYPPRKKWTALTLVALIFLGFGAVVVVGVLSALRRDLKAYADRHAPQPPAEPAKSEREQWIEE
jgi:hypothetical protein